MSKAAELLRRGPVVAEKEKENKTKLTVTEMGKEVRLFGRATTLGAAVRYWRLLARREKEVKAAMDAAKKCLRVAAGEVIESTGRYVSSVVIGDVKVSRQNRFKPVKFSKEELIDAIGNVEYNTLFVESANIGFDDSDHLSQFVRRCDMAGVSISGEKSVSIKPRPSCLERLSEIEQLLSEDSVALLKECAKDSALTVGRERMVTK